MLLVAVAASCGSLRASTQPGVVPVAYAPDAPTAVPERLAARVPAAVQLAFTPLASADDVRQAVHEQRAAPGLVFPDGLDAALRAGQAPTITLVRRAGLDSDAAAVVPTVGLARQDVAGRPGASIAEEIEPPATTGRLGTLERLGVLGLLASLAVLLVLTSVGTMIVPSLVQEEVEKKTLAALLLVARPGQIGAGKGLTGLLYSALLVPASVLLSGLQPAEPLPVVAALALLGMWLVEVGLGLGLVIERRTYETLGPIVSMWVLLVPAVVAIVVGSGGVKTGLLLWPPAAAAWLLLDGLTGVELYTAGPWAVLALLGWVAATYVALVALLRRREL